jgi:hypothetical protein
MAKSLVRGAYIIIAAESFTLADFEKIMREQGRAELLRETLRQKTEETWNVMNAVVDDGSFDEVVASFEKDGDTPGKSGKRKFEGPDDQEPIKRRSRFAANDGESVKVAHRAASMKPRAINLIRKSKSDPDFQTHVEDLLLTFQKSTTNAIANVASYARVCANIVSLTF